MGGFSCLGWLKALRRKSGVARRVPCRPQRPPGRRCVLWLEALEDRTVPSTLTVTNLLDSGAGSLRGQITAAAAGDTIVFASGLSGTITLTGGALNITRSV